uniref:HAT C-terminal dimerisation domain-containing protein n=1 Tax=Rhizophagus irregularis (strain DAOM 181602 / DAOM 197198 / MUCL 43194) TaxID=747089 RepID=U9SIY2_RHIID
MSAMLMIIHNSIIDALNFDSLHAGDDQRDRDRAKKLLELVDSKFKISTMYMIDLTYLLTILEVKSSLDATIATIKTQFISFDDQPPIYGTNLQQFLQNNPFYNNHIPDDFVHFAKALVHSLQARFPCNDLYDSMKILDPKELPLQESALSSYGIEELKLICEHFGNQKHKSNGIPVQPLINSSECKKEWQMVKYMKSIRNYDIIIEGWHHIWSTRSQFKNQFPNVNILVNIVLLVPLSNANVERVYAFNNTSDNIEEFNWDKAFNQWKNEHVRRVNTNNV